MPNIIIKTILHLKDEKGWEKEIEKHGDFTNNFCIIRSFYGSEYYEVEDETVVVKPCKDYRFESVKTEYERYSGQYAIKHVYMEMK